MIGEHTLRVMHNAELLMQYEVNVNKDVVRLGVLYCMTLQGQMKLQSKENSVMH